MENEDDFFTARSKFQQDKMDTKRTNIDTTSEDFLKDTEDEVMRAHMDKARETYYETLSKAQEISFPVERSKAVQAVGKFTTALLSMDDEMPKHATASDHLSILSRHLMTLPSKPRGIPPHFDGGLSPEARTDETVITMLESAAGVIDKVEAKTTEHDKFLKELQSKLRVARQELDQSVGRLIEIIEKKEALIREQRNLLASAQKVYMAEELKAAREMNAIRRGEDP